MVVSITENNPTFASQNIVPATNLTNSGLDFEVPNFNEGGDSFRSSGLLGLRDRIRRTMLNEQNVVSGFSNRRRIWGHTRIRDRNTDRDGNRERLSSARRERRERSRIQMQADAAGLFRLNNITTVRLSKISFF